MSKITWKKGRGEGRSRKRDDKHAQSLEMKEGLTISWSHRGRQQSKRRRR